jgi:molecular chaperone GrpE (heat shock protein)
MQSPNDPSALDPDRPAEDPIGAEEKSAPSPEPLAIDREQLERMEAWMQNANPVLAKMEKRTDAIFQAVGRISQSQNLAADQMLRLGEKVEEVVSSLGESKYKNLLTELVDFYELFSGLLESTAKASEDAENAGPWQLLKSQLEQMLSANGIVKIDPGTPGGAVDFQIHRPIDQQPASSPEQVGQVLKICRPGYRLGSRILRRVDVIVGSEPVSP